MKEALYYKVENNVVKCLLCPRGCTINKGRRGFCGVRENRDNKLYSLVYGKLCSKAIDPIEKKPLYHFIPGHGSYSIATVGCNLTCKHCQNWEISQTKQIFGQDLTPEDVVNDAIAYGCKSIAYTYTEPTIFYEFMLDTAKIAKKHGIKNVIVSNGYINKEPLKKLCKYIDGANIDLKGFNENFYKEVCSAELKPVLSSLKTLKANGVWLEVTNLIIPTLNDNLEEIEKLCNFIVKNLGKDTPLHFSRFFPHYKLTYISPTPPQTLIDARTLALKKLHYVYIGNLLTDNAENTYCPKCGKLLIERLGFSIIQNNLVNGKCYNCNYKIAGVWYA